MSAPKPFYITTPIYYVNDAPHIGHAYTTVACDAMARFMRLDGYDVAFLTGTDEHGQKVEKAARDAGLEPKPFTDRVSGNFRRLADDLGCSHTDFIRTTEERHIRACQAIWRALEAAGDIYPGSYSGWYSVRDEAFFTESELETNADGARIAPTGAVCEWVEEPSYFFRLSAWQDRLLAFYEANPDCIAPETRRNEVLSFVRGGLQDLSISRTTFDWGVPVPGNPSHVMYVWLDALTNYATAVGYPDTDSPSFRRFWPADLHMVGKDILRFHAVYWPAFLMAAGLRPPKRVFAHGWWTNEGEKISKSLGNVIDPYALIGEFGLDQVRYFLLREVPFGNDGDFSRRSIVQRINGELANDYGNLVQRTLSMVNRNCEGRVPEPGARTSDDEALLGEAYGLLGELRSAMRIQAFHEALEAIWRVVRSANGYVARNEPWALKGTDPGRMAAVLHTAAEVIRCLALATSPFMPDSSGRILDQLGVADGARGFAAFGPDEALAAGTTLPKPSGVFPRHGGTG